MGDDRGRVDFFERFGGKMYQMRYSLNHGKGPRNYKRSDVRISEDIHERLTSDHLVDATEMSVEVVNGDVILSSFAQDGDEKRRAEDIAESVVKSIENRIRILNRLV